MAAVTEGDAVRVRVPASTANLGPGFDSMGLAVGLWDTYDVRLTDGEDAAESVVGEGSSQVPRDGRHLVIRSMRLDAAAPALLILTDSYYPGWQATLDGEAVTIYEADLLFRGVFVPEGEHQLVLSYEPVSWARGRVVSLITLIFWLSLVSVQLFRPAVKPPG